MLVTLVAGLPGSGKTTHFAHTVDYATPFAHDFHAQ